MNERERGMFMMDMRYKIKEFGIELIDKGYSPDFVYKLIETWCNKMELNDTILERVEAMLDRKIAIFKVTTLSDVMISSMRNIVNEMSTAVYIDPDISKTHNEHTPDTEGTKDLKI